MELHTINKMISKIAITRYTHDYAKTHTNMFDFERLEVYGYARALVNKVLIFLADKQQIDPFFEKKLKSTVTSMLFNLAEGTGRMTHADKRQYLTVARSSVFESVAVLHTMLDLKMITDDQYQSFYDDLEQVSKMLLGMIRSFSK